MSKFRALSKKFRTAFLVVAVIPIIVFGIIMYVQIRTTTIDAKKYSLYSVAENKRLTLEIWIEELQLRSISIRTLPELGAFVRSLASGGNAGTNHAAAEEHLDLALREKISAKEEFTGIYLLSPRGELSYSFIKRDDNRQRNFSGEEFFEKGDRQDSFSGITISPFSRNRCFIFSSPIRDDNGALRAVLVLEATVDKLLQILGASGEVSETPNMMLVNSEGYVMYQSGGSIHFPVLQKATSEGIVQALMGRSITGTFAGADKEPVIGAYLWYPEKKWVVAAEIPTSIAIRNANMLLYFNLVLVIVIVIVIFVVSRYYGIKFADPIVTLTDNAALVSGGDLRPRVSIATNDEIGSLAKSFNAMIDSLASISKGILDMSAEIGKAANGILASTAEQEQISLQQSSAMSETSATIEELSVSAKQVAQSAQSIMKQVEGTAAKIMFFSQKAQEINKISAAIEEIAQQIHLLSLNASIESARAGEHGKGFGVVAAEIRKLSENANRQTGEITAIVQDIQDAISTVVLATEQAVNGVRSITISVQEQDTATDQIAQAMQEINIGMKQSLEGTKQTIETVEELRAVMKKMDDHVGQFKLS
jgi:methyl-accepting chemotaxis protein